MSLERLLSTPMDQRDPHWEDNFFLALTETEVKVLTPDPQTGPDDWPYIMVEIAEDGKEPVQKLLQWLATKGIGLVVNPNKDYPDFVFNYGMIWHFRETGFFYRHQKEIKGGVVALEEGQKILAGPPTEQYLPNYVRKIIKDFFRDQGLHAVKILMISAGGDHYDLAFSSESLGNPPQQEHEGVAEAISWFLPPHYSILIASEKGLPAFDLL